jgi:hypothetical protein
VGKYGWVCYQVMTSVFVCAGSGAERKCQCYHPEHGKSGRVCDRVVTSVRVRRVDV